MTAPEEVRDVRGLGDLPWYRAFRLSCFSISTSSEKSKNVSRLVLTK